MKRSQERMHEPPASGLGRLQHDTAVTAAELREFLGQMRGKSPQEVMGTIAGNTLVKSTLLAAAATAVFLLLTSTVVYLIAPEKTKNAKGKPIPAVQAKKDAGATSDGQTASNSDSASTADETKSSGDKTLDTLGMGETKISAPDKNPLEDKFEDLLDKKID